jgi:hypothetical protein
MKHFVNQISQDGATLVQGLTLLDHADLVGGPVFQLRQWSAVLSSDEVAVLHGGIIIRNQLDGMLSLPGDGTVEDSLTKAFWR